MEGLVGPTFAAALAADRERFNARFAQARREHPGLDGGAFLEHLIRSIDPAIRAIGELDGSRVRELVEVLYDVSLEMFCKGLIGPHSRLPGFEKLWGELLVGAAPALAAAPGELIPELTNALYNLHVTPRCRPADWLGLMVAVAGNCQDAAGYRAAGQVAAWICGMAQYREAALALARKLPVPLVARLLLPESALGDSVPALLERLAADPWFRPDHGAGQQGLRVVAEVGGFRGFGGEFMRPPLVAARDDRIFVGDGQTCWLLIADAFGAVLHRVADALPQSTGRGPFTLLNNGTVQGRSGKLKLPILAGASSSAGTETTLAATLPMSHRVFLVSEAAA
jgi:hypothetical protein